MSWLSDLSRSLGGPGSKTSYNDKNLSRAASSGNQQQQQSNNFNQPSNMNNNMNNNNDMNMNNNNMNNWGGGDGTMMMGGASMQTFNNPMPFMNVMPMPIMDPGYNMGMPQQQQSRSMTMPNNNSMGGFNNMPIVVNNGGFMDAFNQPPMYQQQQQSRSMTMPNNNFNNFTPMGMPVMPTPPTMPMGMNMGMMGQNGSRSMTQVKPGFGDNMQFGASMVPMMPTGGDFTRSVSTGAMPAMGGMAMDGGWGSTGLPWETNIPGGAFAGLPFNLGTMGGMPTFGLPSFANASAPGNSGIYSSTPLFPTGNNTSMSRAISPGGGGGGIYNSTGLFPSNAGGDIYNSTGLFPSNASVTSGGGSDIFSSTGNFPMGGGGIYSSAGSFPMMGGGFERDISSLQPGEALSAADCQRLGLPFGSKIAPIQNDGGAAGMDSVNMMQDNSYNNYSPSQDELLDA